MDVSGVDQIISIITQYGMNVIGGIALLVIGWIVANKVSSYSRSQLSKTDKIDD
ncbi:MAG: mechanosensitive ion channel family protein, partial [Desulfobulbia bacterium]